MKTLTFILFFILSFKSYAEEADKKYFTKVLNNIIEAEKMTKICLENSTKDEKVIGCLIDLRSKYTSLAREYPGLLEFRKQFEGEVSQFQKDWEAEIQGRILLLFELKSCLKKETNQKAIKTKCFDPFKGKYEKYQSKDNLVNKKEKLIEKNQF